MADFIGGLGDLISQDLSRLSRLCIANGALLGLLNFTKIDH